MPKSYLMSRKWALTDRFAITDESGMPQFEVQGRFAFSKRLSIRDSAGAEVAVISRPGLLTHYENLVGSQLATVRADCHPGSSSASAAIPTGSRK